MKGLTLSLAYFVKCFVKRSLSFAKASNIFSTTIPLSKALRLECSFENIPLMKTISMQSRSSNRIAFTSSALTETVTSDTLENDFLLIGRTSVYFQFSSFEFGNPDSLKSFKAV